MNMKKTFVMFFVLGALSINVLEAYTLVELENLSEKVALQDVLSYGAAFEAANEEFDNDDSEIKVLVFELFYRLALQGQYLEAIFKIVEHGVVDDDFRVRRGSLSLAEALVEEGVYLEELHRLVIPCIYDDNYKVREAAFQAAAVFVEAGHFFEQIFLASEWVLTRFC